MAISIECPACDESFRVPSDAAGKKVSCPSCGNVSRIPATSQAADQNEETAQTKKKRRKTTRDATGPRADQADQPDETPQPPPVQPPQIRPPVQPPRSKRDEKSKQGDSLVTINREPASNPSPTGERRRRKKTSGRWLWGTIFTGGVVLIGLAIATNTYQQKKKADRLADANRADDDGTTENAKTNAQQQNQSSRPATEPNSNGQVKNPSPTEEPFAPFAEESKPVDDPLIKQFQQPEKNTPPDPLPPASRSTFTPDAVASLFEQCQQLQWKPENLSDYAKLQGLAKLVTDCGRAQQSETFETDQKEGMLKAALSVMETLATTSWGDHLQITKMNQLAVEALQNQQELGIFTYAEVYLQANGQLDGANVIFFKIIGTEQHVAVTAKENSGSLTSGTRWLILGEANLRRTVQLMDGNTGNTIKAPLVSAYYLVEEPKALEAPK